MNLVQFLILDCNDVDILKIIYFIKVLLNLAFTILPIGAIIMLSLDMAKGVIAGREEDMSKNLGIFIKRIISLACVFLVYVFVNFVMNFVGNAGVEGTGSWLDCWTKADPDVTEGILEHDDVEEVGNSANKAADAIKEASEKAAETKK